MDKKVFAEKIVEWYEINKRNLPWRETREPYRIWLSEIILQQTRVAQGLPYYLKFIKTFPDIYSLSAAKEESVLRAWQGLGYYTRARNLHRCAKTVVEKFNGKFPVAFAELMQLPGIGTYTAAAIASLAHQERVAVVDGNVYRVLARVFGMRDDISTNSAKKKFLDQAQSIIPAANPDVFNQAVMEFGALQCLPSNPGCDTCVLRKSCAAATNGWQHILPVKSKKPKPRNRYFYYFVFRSRNKVAMQKRTGRDIWHGLFDFFLVESRKPESTKSLISKNTILKPMQDNLLVQEVSPVYHHLLSHQKLFARFISVKWMGGTTSGAPASLRFYTPKQIARLPKPVLVSRFLKESFYV